MNNHEKIAQLLLQSDLSKHQADELTALFAKAEDTELSTIVEILTQDISWAEKIYLNYSAKKEALNSSDGGKLQGIFQDENEMLRNSDR